MITDLLIFIIFVSGISCCWKMCRVVRVLPEMMEEDGQSSVTSARPCLGQLLAAVQKCPTPASRREEDAGESYKLLLSYP